MILYPVYRRNTCKSMRIFKIVRKLELDIFGKRDIIYYMRQRKDDRKKTVRAFMLVTQLGLIMIVSMGMTTTLGIWLDRKLGTSFITVILFFVGAVAGGQSVYRMVKQFDEDDESGKDDKSDDKFSEDEGQDSP